MAEIRKIIETYLQDTESDKNLKHKLEQINTGDLHKHADLWAKALLKRNAEKFLNIYTKGLSAKHHQDLILELLDVIEAQEHPRLTDVLFNKVKDANIINRKLLSLVQSDLPDKTIQKTFKTIFSQNNGYWQHKKYLKLDDDTALAIYERLSDFALSFFQTNLNYSSRNPEGFPKTLQAIEDSDTKKDNYYQIYRNVANEAQYHRVLESLIDNPPKELYSYIFWQYRPNHYQELDISEEIVTRMLQKFGDIADAFLRNTSKWYGAKVIRETIQRGDNAELLQTLNHIRYGNEKAIKATEAEWAPIAFERAPGYFEKFIKYNLKNKSVIRKILPLAKDNGQLDLYQHLYARMISEKEWYQDIAAILAKDKSSGEILFELDWIDLPNRNIRLSDDLATQLYNKHPATFQEFIRRHVRVQNVKSFDYPQLKAAMNANGDDFWWEIFREVATVELWQESLQDLLDQDVSPDQIADELEKRHPANVKAPTDALQPFLTKYGDAMRPYLEKHVKMLTEKRLKQLLALDIDRAELRQVLEDLSRRQPNDFHQLVHIWLPALYDPNTNFWDTLILRNLSWRLPDNHGLDELINQMESDGKHRLFSTIYRMTKSEEDWNRDIVRLATSDLSDDDVMAALERRRMWGTLTDKSATALYQRSPDKFRDYIQSRLQTRYYYYGSRRIKYTQLTKLAEAQGDTILAQSIRQGEDGDGCALIAFQALEDESITAEAVLEDLQSNRHYMRSTPEFAEKLMQLFERFGEPLLDFMLSNRWLWSRGLDHSESRFTDKLETMYDPGTDEGYWGAFFRLHDMGSWNKELRKLVESINDDDLLFQRLALMEPRNYNVWGADRWQIDDKVVLELIRRDKERAYPFLRAHTIAYSKPLFKLAVEMDDTDLIDTIVYRVLVSWREKTPKPIAKYLEKLLTEHSDQFVRRASNIFSHISAFEIYYSSQFLERPIYKILVQPRELWLQSSSAIRDLLESPSIYVIYIGLELLAESGELSAKRTHDNLFWIRSFLLGRAKRNTKTLALNALLNAAEHGYADDVFKLLEEVKDFQGKRAIDDKILVAYGRLQHLMREGERI